MARRKSKGKGVRAKKGARPNDVPEERQLGLMGLNIQEHWKKYRPTMYRELERSGRLKEALLAAEARVNDVQFKLEDQGLAYDQAWEIARQEAFYPDEEDMPELGLQPGQ